MNLLMALLVSLGATTPSISLTGGTWAAVNGASPATSSTKTVVVPSGSSGVIRFDDGGGSGTVRYSKNGGAFDIFSTGTLLTLANGDTLALRIQGTSGDNNGVTVYDNVTDVIVGTCDMSIA